MAVKKYRASNMFECSEIDNEILLIPKNESDVKQVLVLGEVASFIWKQLMNQLSENEIVEAIMQQYDVSLDKAISDIESFISGLLKHNAIEEVVSING